MRLSANEGEPGFAEYAAARANGKPIRVFLDGAEVNKVIAFDEDAGWLRRYSTDAAGWVRLSDDGKEALVETLTGNVRAVLDDA